MDELIAVLRPDLSAYEARLTTHVALDNAARAAATQARVSMAVAAARAMAAASVAAAAVGAASGAAAARKRKADAAGGQPAKEGRRAGALADRRRRRGGDDTAAPAETPPVAPGLISFSLRVHPDEKVLAPLAKQFLRTAPELMVRRALYAYFEALAPCRYAYLNARARHMLWSTLFVCLHCCVNRHGPAAARERAWASLTRAGCAHEEVSSDAHPAHRAPVVQRVFARIRGHAPPEQCNHTGGPSGGGERPQCLCVHASHVLPGVRGRRQ